MLPFSELVRIPVRLFPAVYMITALSRYSGIPGDKGGLYLRPRTLVLNCVNDLLVRDITIRNSPMFHIVSQGGSRKLFDNVSLLSGCGPEDGIWAPNTDGFNVGGTNVTVRNSRVRNGDDCMPFSGKNVLAENVICECGNSPGLCLL